MQLRVVAALAIVVVGAWVVPSGVIGAQTLPTVTVTSTTNGTYTFQSSPNGQPCSLAGDYVASTPAQFILTRKGDTTATLTIDIAWSGTATTGNVVTPTSVEFAAGSATATVTPSFSPTPFPNGGISEVTLTVVSGAGYQTGDPANGTASLSFPVPSPCPPPPPPPVESHPTFTG
jgi:hypothetical protein